MLLGADRREMLREMPVAFDAPGKLHASLLDARLTFDRLIERYAPDEESRRRVLGNRFYQHLSGTLGGILEYMAVERLFEGDVVVRVEQFAQLGNDLVAGGKHGVHRHSLSPQPRRVVQRSCRAFPSA